MTVKFYVSQWTKKPLNLNLGDNMNGYDNFDNVKLSYSDYLDFIMIGLLSVTMFFLSFGWIIFYI
jgi:hypothetical protein